MDEGQLIIPKVWRKMPEIQLLDRQSQIQTVNQLEMID